MVRSISVGVTFLLLYILLITPFTTYLRNKPFVEKLGYIPSVIALKAVAADQKELVAATMVMKVLMYFGGLVQKSENQFVIPPDYMSMSRILHGAVKIDPYNMDAYYFAQAFLTWDVKQYKLAVDLLDYGMKYRTWDWTLPFYAGFNSAFFLKDYAAAAKYYQLAGTLSGSDLSILLAGRYMQESGQTELAINYLAAMVKNVNNPALKKSYQFRLNAFREVHRIELARERYLVKFNSMPGAIGDLLKTGLLAPPPKDPYGGQFYLGTDGKVMVSSKFAFPQVNDNMGNRSGDADERH